MSTPITKKLAAAIATIVFAAGLFTAPVSGHEGHTPNPTVADIEKRDELIAAQEALLNVYRCMFNVDTQIVPGGCRNGAPVRAAVEAGEFEGTATTEEVSIRDHLIGDQEALLNVYRCKFNVDTQIVPGGCVDGAPAVPAYNPPVGAGSSSENDDLSDLHIHRIGGGDHPRIGPGFAFGEPYDSNKPKFYKTGDPTASVYGADWAPVYEPGDPSFVASMKQAVGKRVGGVFQQWDDVWDYTFDADRRIVVLRIPHYEEGYHGDLTMTKDQGFTIERIVNVGNSASNRAFVQTCMRYAVDKHRNKSIREYAAAIRTALGDDGLDGCLKGVIMFQQWTASFWLDEKNLECFHDETIRQYTATENNRLIIASSDNGSPRPPSVCASLNYDPKTQGHRPIMELCYAVVDAYPNSDYPPYNGSLTSLESSCAKTVIGGRPTSSYKGEPYSKYMNNKFVLEVAYQGNADTKRIEARYIAQGDDTYHRLLGFAWARQTGRDNRPPGAVLDLDAGAYNSDVGAPHWSYERIAALEGDDAVPHRFL